MVRLYLQFRGWKQLRESREGMLLRFWLIVSRTARERIEE